MKYADMAVPSRALHLWRYTPWARIHPSKVDEVPEANAVQFKVLEGGDLVEGAPKELKTGVSKKDAEEVKKKFEAAGAKVELK